LRVLVLMKIEKRVVAVIADIGVVAPAPEVRRVEPRARVLVHLPGDARLQQTLGVGRPVVSRLGVVDDRAAVLAVVADPARPHVIAVRVRRTEDRAVVGVADGERVGQRVVERDVAPGQMRHRGGALRGHPLVVLPVVPGLVLVRPAVREILEKDEPEVGRVGMKRQQGGRAVRLVEDGLARSDTRRPRIAVPAHAPQGAEVVIERPVLLHEDDDVLDVLERPGPVVRRERKGALDAGGDGRRECARAQELEEEAAVGSHREPPSRAVGVERRRDDIPRAASDFRQDRRNRATHEGALVASTARPL
jgi:hypothetical protein